MITRLAGCIALALVVAAPLAQAQTADAAPVRISADARLSPAQRERLLEFDLTEAQIRRLHGPIGLYIGSRTPPEIAISILAEITAAKNGVAADKIESVAVAKEKLGPSVACATS